MSMCVVFCVVVSIEKKDNLPGSENFYIQPLDNDLYEWHFTIKGCKDTVYDGGLYHGYFQIPKDYPLAPPNIYFMNKSGRYEINKKICMNITSYHKEEWTPAWTLRTMMEAVCAYFTVEDRGIGSIKLTPAARKKLAKESVNFVCPKCGPIKDIVKKNEI